MNLPWEEVKEKINLNNRNFIPLVGWVNKETKVGTGTKMYCNIKDFHIYLTYDGRVFKLQTNYLLANLELELIKEKQQVQKKQK